MGYPVSFGYMLCLSICAGLQIKYKIWNFNQNILYPPPLWG
eukprot:SAG31_NODE_23921_length_492_cov_2.483461_1_plen_40_part_10